MNKRIEKTEDDLLAKAAELKARAETMLAWPLARTVVETGPGGVSFIIEPANWQRADAAKLLRLALEIESAVFSRAFWPRPAEDAPPKPRQQKRRAKPAP